jgi:hypothetical protein
MSSDSDSESINPRKEPVKKESRFDGHLKMEGSIRMKPSKGGGAFSSSSDRYFMFMAEGRILAGFARKPKSITEKPKYAILTRFIAKVINNYKGNKGDFFIDSEYAKDEILHVSKEEDSLKWAKAIEFFQLHYQKTTAKPYEVPERNFGAVDPRVMVEIMIQVELSFPEELAKRRDFIPVQDSKGLTKYLAKCGEATLENRMGQGLMRQCLGQAIDSDMIEPDSPGAPSDPFDGGNAITSGGKTYIPDGSYGGTKYGIIVTAKDLDYEDDDDEIMTNKR